MSSKGAITITQDDLIKMKMRANIIPNRITPHISQKKIRTSPSINISRAKSEPTSGSITLKISRNAKRKRDIENSRRRSSNVEKQMRKRKDSSKKRKNKNQLLPMPNSSKIHKKSELSIANFSSLILSKEDNNSSRSKNTSRTQKKKDNSSITKKQWYLVVYVESSQTE